MFIFFVVLYTRFVYSSNGVSLVQCAGHRCASSSVPTCGGRLTRHRGQSRSCYVCWPSLALCVLCCVTTPYDQCCCGAKKMKSFVNVVFCSVIVTRVVGVTVMDVRWES